MQVQFKVNGKAASVDVSPNTLLVQDTADKLTEIRNVVKALDVPVRQVMIEARIVEANDTWGKNQGGFRVDWEPSSADRLTLQGDAYAMRQHGPDLRLTLPVFGVPPPPSVHQSPPQVLAAASMAGSPALSSGLPGTV